MIDDIASSNFAQEMNTTLSDQSFESPILCLQEFMQADLIEDVFFEISLKSMQLS